MKNQGIIEKKQKKTGKLKPNQISSLGKMKKNKKRCQK